MKKILLILATLTLLTACKTTQPIYNANVTLTTDLSNNKIEKAIIQAINYKQWRVLSKTDNKIVAAINVRSHYAEIVITYNQAKFEINYQNSNNLDFNAEKQGIHRNYNKWINLLANEIQRNINLLSMQG